MKTPEPAEPIVNLLVVGGGSRVAIAFRRWASGQPWLALKTLVRRAMPSFAGEVLTPVENYFHPPKGALLGSSVVVNFAGIPASRDYELLQRVNGDGPKQLAAAASDAGVCHLVHLSTVKVYDPDATRITRDTAEQPATPYGQSKLMGDRALLEAQKTGMKIALLRVPMLYGGGTGVSLVQLARMIARIGVFPVPPSPVERSILHLENLSHAIGAVVRNGLVGVLHAADYAPLTHEGLAAVVEELTGKPVRLVHLSRSLFLPIRVVAKGLYERLYQSRIIDPRFCIIPDEPFPATLSTGLREAFCERPGSARAARWTTNT